MEDEEEKKSQNEEEKTKEIAKGDTGKSKASEEEHFQQQKRKQPKRKGYHRGRQEKTWNQKDITVNDLEIATNNKFSTLEEKDSMTDVNKEEAGASNRKANDREQNVQQEGHSFE
ncbi:hypothetical protein FXO38_09789 [Capsicum annuum]|nr:hypothetical protein FXO38_09789 [Capsicum annuum]KAF3667736.1 hypothetical protein FXO37_09884 [Capsicum annuum]